jgi:uncharacterized membrane protein
MLRLIAVYLATAASFAAIDYIWLTQLSAQVYHPTLDTVVLPSARIGPAVVFYLVYILGVLVLAIWPTRNEALWKTTVTGGLLGAMCYATYDLTNQATLVVWATSITLADIAWGTVLTAAGASVGGYVLRRMKA